VIAGELKGRIDRVWDAFSSGGISNPLEVLDQITYLMFLRRLDDLQTAAERNALRTGRPAEHPVYTDATRHLRWRELIDTEPQRLFGLMADEVFPWLRELDADQSTYARNLRDARFTIPTASLLTRAMDIINRLPTGADAGRGGGEDDVEGDLYEYLLGKFATSGQNGQFPTPRHIIELIVAMTDPQPDDEICDPACGTATSC
jgi:type I restriction enzyme M protein